MNSLNSSEVTNKFAIKKDQDTVRSQESKKRCSLNKLWVIDFYLLTHTRTLTHTHSYTHICTQYTPFTHSHIHTFTHICIHIYTFTYLHIYTNWPWLGLPKPQNPHSMTCFSPTRPHFLVLLNSTGAGQFCILSTMF